MKQNNPAPHTARKSQFAVGAASMATASLALLPTGAQAGSPQTLSQYEAANPGAGYREIFISQDTTTAASADMNSYNAFVNSEASQPGGPGGVQWAAVISTPTISALQNTDCLAACDAVPIFDLQGKEIAASTTAFFGGGILSYITVNQFGVNDGGGAGGYAWTGSTAAGAIFSQHYASGGGVIQGSSVYPTNTVNPNVLDIGFAPSSNSASLYGISQEIIPTVNAVPEPASMSLFGLGAAALAVLRRRRKA